MRTPLFHATCVAIVKDDIGIVVGFADQEFGTERYLQFQRSHTSDAQDRELGQDTYYVERDDQSNGCYGGIETIDLRQNSLSIKLDRHGCEHLNVGQFVLITFELENMEFEELRSALSAVFSGSTTILAESGE